MRYNGSPAGSLGMLFDERPGGKTSAGGSLCLTDTVTNGQGLYAAVAATFSDGGFTYLLLSTDDVDIARGLQDCARIDVPVRAGSPTIRQITITKGSYAATRTPTPIRSTRMTTSFMTAYRRHSPYGNRIPLCDRVATVLRRWPIARLSYPRCYPATHCTRSARPGVHPPSAANRSGEVYWGTDSRNPGYIPAYHFDHPDDWLDKVDYCQ